LKNKNDLTSKKKNYIIYIGQPGR